MQIQAQASNHDHCSQDKNETSALNDKIRLLEMANDQKSAEIGRLSLKIAEQELKIKEEANKASAQLSQCSQYVEEITSLKSKILSLEYT
jgi:chromosome segregation ATPase